MKASLLYGLTPEDSVTALNKLLFSPAMRQHFGEDHTLDWCVELVESAGDMGTFSAQYNRIAAALKQAPAFQATYSIETLPPAMISVDLVVGAVPWVSPLFDRWLFLFLSNAGAVKGRVGKALALAFILSGGPGNSKDSAIRICAPSQTARVSAEYWIMRGYLWRKEDGAHFNLEPDENGRTFSQHYYIDPSGQKRSLYFETTESAGREEADFLDLIHRTKACTEEPVRELASAGAR